MLLEQMLLLPGNSGGQSLCPGSRGTGVAAELQRGAGVGESKSKMAAAMESGHQPAAAPHLDGSYTVFGRVLSGMDVLAKLTPRDPGKSAALPDGDILISVTIEER